MTATPTKWSAIMTLGRLCRLRWVCPTAPCVWPGQTAHNQSARTRRATACIDQNAPFRCTTVSVRSRRNQSFPGTTTTLQQCAHVSYPAATGQSLRLAVSKNTCLSCVCDGDGVFRHLCRTATTSGIRSILCRRTAASSRSRRSRVCSCIALNWKHRPQSDSSKRCDWARCRLRLLARTDHLSILELQSDASISSSALRWSGPQFSRTASLRTCRRDQPCARRKSAEAKRCLG